ncbi:hypothetical protein B0J12DRAFT_784167 [Macrophomina phaseolina]|uniref:Uncharacterized protein n=1 Tax=Macrophomina phaseolina TaxID=35725 RepID=A0ABQ8GHK2_9PEZI|nr:hypothetical protein B0J12DRAFT_784167 [Macrophomina phaseolina]
MQSEMLHGLSNSVEESGKQTPFQCPSGNCTLGPFDSLTVHSVCIDPPKAIPEHEGVSIGLRDDLCIDNINSFNGTVDADEKRDGALFMDAFCTGKTTRTCSMQAYDALIWSMTMFKARRGPSNRATNPTFQEGALNEIETARANVTAAGPSQESGLVSSNSGTGSFNVSRITFSRLSSFFEKWLAADYYSLGGQNNGGYMATAQEQLELSTMQPCWESANLSHTFDSIARSMSNAVHRHRHRQRR